MKTASWTLCPQGCFSYPCSCIHPIARRGLKSTATNTKPTESRLVCTWLVHSTQKRVWPAVFWAGSSDKMIFVTGVSEKPAYTMKTSFKGKKISLKEKILSLEEKILSFKENKLPLKETKNCNLATEKGR
jgi:hypothetical protein